MMDNMDINSKILSALQSACPMQLWGLHAKGYFILNTGAGEKHLTRTEAVDILNRERATLEVKASLIQTTLDLLKEDLSKEKTIAEIYETDTISIGVLQLTDEQKERVLEWYAEKVWQLLQDLDISDGCSKRYDPLTIKDGIAHSYVFDLEDGGRRHFFRDYEHLEEMIQNELLETIRAHFSEGEADLSEENSTAEILVDADLFDALVLVVINAKSILEFPEDVRDALEESDRTALDQAVKILNAYKRKIGEEEIY